MSFDIFSPALVVAGAFAAAVAAPFVVRPRGVAGAGVLALFPAAAFVFLVLSGRGVWGDGVVWRGTVGWAPQIGVDWDLWVSPLGLLLGLLVTGIGTLVAVYAAGYLSGSAVRGRFFGFFFLFMGAMLGLAFTENLVVLFLFWELTSVASFLLIGFYHKRAESRSSARDALLVTGFGGVVLLGGILLLGEVGGSYRIGELIENRDAILRAPLYPAVFFCIFVGAATKSAQVPLHFWLPGAMAAPAPVSAFLHSATMVKAGVFLLAVFHPLLGGTPLWHFTLLGVGTATMTWGALVAVVQTDLKRLLAYTTVSALGTLVMLLGIENTLAAKAAVVFFIVHAFYKGALFMVAGALEKTTGTRDVNALRGLMASMPVLGVAAIFAAASMSGIPPFIGFIAKELLYEVKIETPLVGGALLLCGFVANAATIVVAAKVGLAPFFGVRGVATPLKTKLGPALWVGPAVLGAGSLALGVFPDAILGSVVTATAGQIKMEPVEVTLKLWHGFNVVLLLSAATVVAGAIGFVFRERLWTCGQWLSSRIPWKGQQLFRGGLAGFLRLADGVTRGLQSGDLRQYFLIIFSTGVALLAWAFYAAKFPLEIPSGGVFRPDVAVVTGLVAAAVLGVVRARKRMMAVLFLGCAGFGIAGLFALYGAPDLAITQILVETFTLVLFALALYGLPELDTVRRGRWRDGLAFGVSVLVGAAFTLLTLKALAINFHEPVAREIARASLPEGFGRNVVNVILVDFRAFDTLGEVSVLVIAALGVRAMLHRPGRKDDTSPGLSEDSGSAVLVAAARYVSPAMVVVSLYLLLRGHNDPGGGFIGGLVAAMAAVLNHLANPGRAPTFANVQPLTLAVTGLGVAVASGVPGLFADGSFLAAQWGPAIPAPFVGKIKLGTPLVFDVGVYLAVAGVVLLLYQVMERARPARKRARKEVA